MVLLVSDGVLDISGAAAPSRSVVREGSGPEAGRGRGPLR